MSTLSVLVFERHTRSKFTTSAGTRCFCAGGLCLLLDHALRPSMQHAPHEKTSASSGGFSLTWLLLLLLLPLLLMLLMVLLLLLLLLLLSLLSPPLFS